VNFSARQLDALKELANVGSGHAATALSKLLGGRRVAIDPPRAEIGLASSLFQQAPAQGVVASLELQGTPAGALLFALTEDDARQLSAQLLGHDLREGELSAEARDALSETANIVASAYLGALAMMTGVQLVPSVPRLTQEGLEAAAHEVSERLGEGTTIVLDVRFAAATTSGELWLMLAPHSARELLSRLVFES
jgi:chemotaxis protein CheC